MPDNVLCVVIATLRAGALCQAPDQKFMVHVESDNSVDSLPG